MLLDRSCSLQRLLKAIVISSVVNQQSASDARVLVGQCYRSDIPMTPLDQPVQPPLANWLPVRSSECRLGSLDEQRARVRVATLTDPEQLRFATGGVLRRHQPQLCR